MFHNQFRKLVAINELDPNTFFIKVSLGSFDSSLSNISTRDYHAKTRSLGFNTVY